MVYEINTAPEGRRPGSRSRHGCWRNDRSNRRRGQILRSRNGGQDVVLVMETLGQRGSGSVSLTVIDTVAPDLLGYVSAMPERRR